ncbi:MAG TPA: NAD-dependent epimerase/dehydratase family protein, partial [Vicinamibacterales bacterium]
MNVFVAGGSGTIGVPLVRGLVARNHRVFATTRSPAKQTMIRSLGATPVLIDALDAAALERAVRDAAPTHVVHELTALPRTAPRSARDLEPTNRLREEGTRNLLKAA